ncbi:MAG TPA: type II secretion system F family protein [Verrucomicrobiae bacterium]|nr:type II secretion system F family protein [Verrucomicrobiae bacterium]
MIGAFAAATLLGLVVAALLARRSRRVDPGTAHGPAWWPAAVARRRLVVLAVAAGAALVLVGLSLPLVGGAALAAVGTLAWLVSARRRGRARRARRLALVEAIELLVQLLPTGQGLRQSLEVLSQRGPARLRPEVSRLIERGRRAPFETAVRELEARLDDPLASLLAVALIVGNRSGGQLVPLFSELGRSARAVELVRGQVDAEQAQGRYGAAVICCMPVAVVAVLRLVNPAYLAPYTTAQGQAVLAGIAALMVIGYGWMRRILRLPEPDRLPLRTGPLAAAAMVPDRRPARRGAGHWVPRAVRRSGWAAIGGAGTRSASRASVSSGSPAPAASGGRPVPLAAKLRRSSAPLPPPPPPPVRESEA